MRCPDCKIPMEEVKFIQDEHGNLVQSFLPIWKCPRCKIEIEEGED